MKFRLKSAVAVTAALGLAAAGLVAIAQSANAYTGTPPWAASDTFNKGGLAFFDASGTVISGGSNVNVLGAYVQALTAPRTSAFKANLTLAFPDHANALPSTWYNQTLQGSTTFSPAPAGTPTAVANGNAFVKLSLGTTDVEDGLSGGTLDSSSAAYQNVFELRMQDTGPSTPNDGAKYWAADIEYNPSKATSAYDGLAPGAWRQIYPAVTTKTATSITTPVATPVSPAAHGSTVGLTASVSAGDATHPAGTVTFYDGATSVGAATFDATTGSASISGLTPSDGSHSYTAKFVPTDTATYSGATSAALAYTVTAVPAIVTSVTTPVATPASPADHGATVSLAATVSAADSSHPAGAVEFFDGATDLGAATSFTAATGDATITGLTPADGPHSYTAKFTPSDTAYAVSTSAALAYTVNAAPKDNTATSLVASPASSGTTSTPVVLTATVTDTTAPATVPAGSVTFKDGTAVLGSPVTVSSAGIATTTVPASTLSIGSHSLSADFSSTANFADSSSPTVTYSATLPAPAVVSGALIVGSARVGASLTCYAGVWTYAGGYTYRWYLDGSSIPFKSTAVTPALPVSYYGHRVRCVVTATNSTGSVTSTTAAPVVALGAAPRATARPKILGGAAVGHVLVANHGAWSPAPAAYRYTWMRGKVVVSHAAKYKVTKADKGKVLVLYVYAVRAGYVTGVSNSFGVKVR